MLRWFFGAGVREEPKILRQNLSANMVDGAMYSLGMCFVSLQTVLPVLVHRISGSSLAVGLIPVLWTAGFNFPQIFIANHVERFAFKRTLFLRTAFFQRVPWFLLSLLLFFVVGRTESLTGLLLFFILFTLAAIAGSLCFPVWFDLIAKLTPVHFRGRLFGARNLLGGVLGVLGGWIVKVVLGRLDFPTSYGVLFVLAVLCMAVSYWSLTLLREEFPSITRQPVPAAEYYRKLPKILKRHRNFRNFLISDALLIAATMAGAFYAVHALQKFSLSESYAGIFTIVIMCSMIVGNALFGFMADHFGHKMNLVLAAVFTAIACLVALCAPGPYLYLASFVGLAFQIGLSGISRLSIVAELCEEAERPTYVALANMVTSPVVLFGVVAGGIASAYGYEVVFAIAALLAITSALWMAFKVDEPRGRGSRPFVQPVQYES